MEPTNALNAPVDHPESLPEPSTPITPAPSLVATVGEQCPSCSTQVASDQRYCLTCGARCGEPRLPFMDAVTFMDAMKQPGEASTPPPQRPQRRLSPNTALMATVGILLLAMGVGVLIGRSGNHSIASAPVAPQVIKVGDTGENGTASNESANGAGTIGDSSKKQKPKALKKEAETQKGAEEVLKPANGVKLPKATAQPGEHCASGTAGCKHGEFTGEYFGEE